jgi:shikimate dehydrogenase
MPDLGEKPPLPRVAGIVGWPIGHTLSPLIHQIWAGREGLDAVYLPVAAEPGYDVFARAAEALRNAGFRGLNVTIPHKENALAYAQAASPAAKKAGAANMLTFAPDGPYADNSDIEGFAKALAEGSRPGEIPARAVVLGAGGAARGVVLALKGLGIGDIVIANRTEKKAARLAKDFGARAVAWEERARALKGAGLLVNATSLGMDGAPALEIALDTLPADAIVADIVYRPLQTPLLAAARAQGLRAADGLSMLMHQAAAGYKAWLGTTAEVDADLRRRLEAALDEGKTR